MAYNQPNGEKMDNSPFRIKGNPNRAKNLKQAINPFDPQSKAKREYNKNQRIKRKKEEPNKDFFRTAIPRMAAYIGSVAFGFDRLNKFLNK